MCKVCDTMEKLMEKFKSFSIFDIAVFKFCLISFGIILGMTGHKSWKKAAPLVWCTFIGGYLYMVYRCFFVHDKKYEDLCGDYDEEDYIGYED